MGRNFKAAGVWLCLVLSLCARASLGKGRGRDVKDRVQESFAKMKQVVDLGDFKFRRDEDENHFQQTPSSNEEIEVVDDNKVQRFDTLSAVPVPESLVEVVVENEHNEPQEDNHTLRDKNSYKPPLKNKNYFLSTTTPKLHEHNVHALQTFPQNIQVKPKETFTLQAHPSRLKTFKSMIVPRVSIPGKHRTLNTSHARFNWTALFSPRQFTSLNYKNYQENMSKLTSTTNGVTKVINQKESNYPSTPDVFSNFITRMGLDKTANLDHVKPRMDVTLSRARTHGLPPKNAHWSKENVHWPMEKVFKPGISNRWGVTEVIKGKPKSLPDLSQALSMSKGEYIEHFPFKNKGDTIQIEPEVYDSKKKSTGKVFKQRLTNKWGATEVIKGKPKRLPDLSSQALSMSKGKHREDFHLKKKGNTTQIEPEVYDNENESTEKVFKQGVSYRWGSTEVIKGKPKSLPDLSQALRMSNGKHREDFPFKKKEHTIQISPGVYDSVKESTEKVVKQRLTNRGNSTEVIKGKPKMLPDLSQALILSKGKDSWDMPLQNEEGSLQMEPEVFDSEKESNAKELLISKGRYVQKSNNVNGRFIYSTANSKTHPTGKMAASHSHALQEPIKSQAADVKISNISLSNHRKVITISNITQAGTIRPQLKSGRKLNKTSKFSDNVKLKVPQLYGNSTLDQENVTGSRESHRNNSDLSGIIIKDNTHSSGQSKGGVPDLALVHIDNSTTGQSRTNVSVKIKSGLNSTISKHLEDLVNFFNSFIYPSNNTNNNLTSNNTIHKIGTTGRNNARNNLSEKHILQNIQTFLNSIHVNKTEGNNTRKVLGMTFRHAVLSHLLSNRNRKILQLSIYRGWNAASKRKGHQLKAGDSNNLTSVKNAYSRNSNATMQFKTGGNLNESGGQAFEVRLLELMKNVGRKELDNLRNDILKALSSNRHRNVSGERQQQSQEQPHHHTRLKKQGKEYQQHLNQSKANQNHLDEEQLKHQQKLRESFNESQGQAFELRLLQVMKNVSREELGNLKNDILKALSSSRLGNFSREHQQTNQQRKQNHTRHEKLQGKEHQTETLNRNNNNQEHLGKEQQTLNNRSEKVPVFPHHILKPQAGAGKQNRTEQNKNHVHIQEIKNKENGTAVRPHQQSEVKQAQLQETFNAKHKTSALNMSHSMNSTTDQNCTSADLNVVKPIKYGCLQNISSNSNSSTNANWITDLSHGVFAASKVHSGKSKVINTTTKTNLHLNVSHNHSADSAISVPSHLTLTSIQLRNFSGEDQRQQQHSARLEKQGKEHQRNVNHNDNQGHLGKEQSKYQEKPYNKTKKVQSLSHRMLKPKAEQHGVEKQNETQRNKNHTYHQQIKDNENGTTLRLHQQSQVGQVRLQETHNSKQKLLPNMSHSMNSTPDQNCTSANLDLVKQIKYGCHQNISSNSSNITNRITDFFHDYLATSKVHSGSFKENKPTTKPNLHLNALHNYSALSISPHLPQHGSESPTKKLQIAISRYKVGNSASITKPLAGLNAAKHVPDDIKNISFQEDTEVSQEKDFKTNPVTQKLGPDVMELTEYVVQGPDKRNPIIKWSEWSPCSASCGSDTRRKRIQYRCASRLQEIRDCVVSGEQQETCTTEPCPVDGWFTPWSQWSPCNRSCGFKGVSVRTRTCTPPRYGGSPCYGARIKTRSCNRKHCPVNGGLSQWSEFSRCSKTCGGGAKILHRRCNNPVPRYGGTECDQSDMFKTQSCGNIRCPAKILKRPQVANVDPKTLCDFNPCEEAGCIYDPGAKCITDFECNPVFFDADGKMLPQCKGMKSLYSRIPNVICSFNPCISERCWEIRDQCVVDLECRAIFIGIDKRAIPSQCQVHSTVRVDRIKGDQSWNNLITKPAPVSLASDLMPSFTQIWFPVFPSQVIQPVVRLPNVNNPLAFSRIFKTYPVITNRKITAHPSEQRLVTVDIEKVRSDADDDHDDDDDDDNDDGYVHDDIDDDDF